MDLKSLSQMNPSEFVADEDYINKMASQIDIQRLISIPDGFINNTNVTNFKNPVRLTNELLEQQNLKVNDLQDTLNNANNEISELKQTIKSKDMIFQKEFEQYKLNIIKANKDANIKFWIGTAIGTLGTAITLIGIFL